VFLKDRNLRCVDGTRPVLYVAPARCTQPGGCLQPGGAVAPFGAEIESDNWIVSFTGGGACHARDTNGDGVYDDGTNCTSVYPSERSEMGTATEPPMKNLGPPAGSSGILSRDPVLNPVFASYHSVRVEKCSYDRYNGRAEHPNVAGSLDGQPFTYTLYSHGQLIAESAIDELLNGLSYTTWDDSNQDGIVDERKARLPRLASARQVLLVGHSGAAHGLRHNADRLAARIQRGAAHPDVRVVFDANFLPSIEGEAAFAPGLNGNPYTGQWVGASSASGQPFTYDGQAFHRSGFVAEQLDSWQTALDESCLAAHPPSTQWQCRDRQHVLFNHLSTPMFVREDQADPNTEHLDGGAGHPITWALLAGCSYQPGPPAPGCDARFAPLIEHRPRLLDLARWLLGGIGTRSEIARGVDSSLGAGQSPSVYLWMPICFSHAGAFSNDAFFSTGIVEGPQTLSMRQALESLLAMPARNAIDWRIHGNVCGRPMSSDCNLPPAP
jgi:hypothetical protein